MFRLTRPYRFSIAMFMLAFPMLVMAQRATIYGYVTDSESGERLIGATVYDSVAKVGTVTNSSGFYSLTLPIGRHALQAGYVGFTPSNTLIIFLKTDTMVVFPLRSSSVINEVVVIGRQQAVSGPNAAQMSAIEVPVAQLKGIPMVGGEADIMKAIQLLPGVQSATEGSAGIYVRGGGPDENLILLDGVPLYSVNHLMGFFSIFNSDAVKNVTLYKGNFPAEYGGRLSGVIDVRQNDGNTESYHGNISVGLLSARFNLEGPIPHKQPNTGNTTFNISARRTYFDLFTTPIMALITKSSTGASATAGAYFYDVNAKLTHAFANNNDKISGSFYMGDDAVYVSTKMNDLQSEIREKQNMKLNMTWGHILGAINWEHCYTPRLFSNLQLSYVRYRYKLKESMFEEQSIDGSLYDFTQEMNYNSSLRDLTLQGHFDWTPLHNNRLRFGASYTFHQFRPEVSNMSVLENEENNTTPYSVDTVLTDGSHYGHEATLYVEDSYSPWQWLKLNVGMRTSLYAIQGKIYPSLEPRVGLRTLFTKDFAFKASYSYTTQYVHMLSNSSVALPTDLWVPVTKDIPPMHAMVVAGGFSYDILSQVEASIEGYYKKAVNVLEYKEGASFFNSGTNWEEKVAVGDGWSYGVEVLLQRKTGALTGWIGYTWSRTMRQFNREGQVINGGKPFHAKYDREHDLSVTLQYQINRKIDVGATFIYGTGTRGTFRLYSFYDPEQDLELGVPTERNNYKMPDYHRLDLGANFHIPHKYSDWGRQQPTRSQQRRIWNNPEKREHYEKMIASGKYAWYKNAEHILSISVYNAYCRANPYLIIQEGANFYQMSLFPIIPSFSYTFKF